MLKGRFAHLDLIVFIKFACHNFSFFDWLVFFCCFEIICFQALKRRTERLPDFLPVALELTKEFSIALLSTPQIVPSLHWWQADGLVEVSLALVVSVWCVPNDLGNLNVLILGHVSTDPQMVDHVVLVRLLLSLILFKFLRSADPWGTTAHFLNESLRTVAFAWLHLRGDCLLGQQGYWVRLVRLGVFALLSS